MLQVLKKAAETIFVPLTVGGGIKDLYDPETGKTVPAVDVAHLYFNQVLIKLVLDLMPLPLPKIIMPIMGKLPVFHQLKPFLPNLVIKQLLYQLILKENISKIQQLKLLLCKQ